MSNSVAIHCSETERVSYCVSPVSEGRRFSIPPRAKINAASFAVALRATPDARG